MSLGASCVLLLAFVLLRSSSSAGSTECKSYDERSRSAGKSSPSGATLDRKVVCSNMELHQVPSPESFPNRTVSLILSNNKIQELLNGSFIGLSSLERLDLSKNLIGCLHVDVFKGLTNLVKLNLSENKFSSLSQGIFDSLGSLKILEFDSPYLLCDCNLQWLVVWIREKAIGVKETRCSFPRSLQGQQITSLRPETLTCDAPLELPSFQMTPSQHQIVFQGDSLPFQCMASFVDEDMQVLWYQDGKMVEPDVTQGIYIEKSMVQNCSLIASALTISNIQPGFTGNWECRVRTSRGNNTRTVHIVVLESSAKYCLPDRVANNKGDYRWPRTLAGITAYLPCKRQVSGAGIYSGSSAEDRRAWRRCGRSGQWAEDDYSRCEYMKDVTRVLYIINQMPLNLTNAVQTAQQLLAYTAEAPNFSDKVDVIFVAEMIEKIGKFAEKYKELGDVMVDISSNLMLADERVLWMAQREARACSRIVECLQRIALLRISNGALAYSTNSHNIALEAHAIKASSFNGMTCTLFQKLLQERTPVAHFSPRDPDINPERQLSFKCNVTSNLSALALKNTIVEASLQLPPSLFSSLGSSGQADDAVYKLHLLAFRNGKLFPPTGNSTLLSDGSKRRSVVTPVILTKIEGFPLKNLQSPVNVTLRRFLHGSDAVPSFWNFSLLGGQGGWQSDGCRILHQDDNFTTMSCHSLNNYALLMDLNRTGNDAYCFEPLHPVIYATAIILVLCLLSVIVSYIYHHKSVRVSKKCWHMLVNLCSHMLLTCAVFVGGINQTHSASVCQAVGIVLHYSTLATALWSGVTARNIYKQVTRKAKRYEELDEPPPPPRPMLRFYLIGGGIPIIVCGITAAANIKNYGSQANAPYCWMAWEPSLGAFYGPAAFIVFVDCMYFLSILVQLRRHPERRFELKELSEEQQHLSVAEATEITPAHLESSSAAQPVPMSALENEHTFVAQLIGVAGSLVLYVALWVFGALAVSQEHPADLVFACLFGTAALALGAFLVAHHCVNRQDMRHHWSRACCLVRRNYAVQIDSLLLPVAGAGGSVLTARGNGETAKCPASSAESSCTNKSAPSVRNSTQGCKLTNLQVEAAQCKAAPSTANGTALLDNSLTEHSVDNEIKMHIAPVEVQYRPNSVNNNNLSGTGITNINGHSGRHHKNRARAHRASRLTVLREYSYDVPTSVEGSVQSVPHKRHHHHESLQARNSRRAAYLAYRERQQSQLQQDSSDASTSVPRRSRHLAKGGGVRPNNSFGHGLSNSLGNGVSNGGLVGGGDGSGTDVNSQTRDCPKQPLTVELEVQPKSYGLNLACQNGPAKDAERLQNLSPLNVESSGNIKTGLWNHETTV
uniref:Adhesion G protein-coupled receptor A3 n=1 Tax=Cyprinus carpio TaxID=7962 RepID=A0A8C2DXZ9_CYPCA